MRNYHFLPKRSLQCWFSAHAQSLWEKQLQCDMTRFTYSKLSHFLKTYSSRPPSFRTAAEVKAGTCCCMQLKRFQVRSVGVFRHTGISVSMYRSIRLTEVRHVISRKKKLTNQQMRNVTPISYIDIIIT